MQINDLINFKVRIFTGLINTIRSGLTRIAALGLLSRKPCLGRSVDRTIEAEVYIQSGGFAGYRSSLSAQF
ncbi:MAG: hypothetical protein EAZ61_05380 [Oscillatoriales cyanobacterium]|nr:MAG: hypothetical protein EAZ61_05380 [Oscillatoriales cyanobacterium]